MSFNIKRMDQVVPEEGKTYLLDANVWKFILSLPTSLNKYEKTYVDFFDAILNLASNPKCKKPPNIYINGLIYSEVYNAYIRSRHDAFDAMNSTDTDLKEYRLTSDYLASLKSIRGDFQAYSSFLKIETDLIHSPEEILNLMPSFSDFNDYYYNKIASSKGLAIVTNDGDFRFQDVEIITMHSKLVALK